MMKRMICALLALLMAMSLAVAAAETITEATMIYEDDDGNRLEQTLKDKASLKALEDILTRTSENPVGEVDHTMNATLMCVTNADVRDFACATDGSAFVIDNASGQIYAVNADDMDAMWALFDEIKAGMGVEAEEAFDW